MKKSRDPDKGPQVVTPIGVPIDAKSGNSDEGGQQ